MKNLFVMGLLLTSFAVFGQLEVVITQNQYLPTYNFFGPNYTVSNVSFVGDTLASAQFNGTNSNLGLENGFMISTGNCSDALSPNDFVDASTDFSLDIVCPLLQSQSGTDLYDGATLTFDIVPQVDSLYFRYVFASEEYEEYVGSAFSDVMGIYIQGPGFPSPTNVAILPDGQIVSVQSVHGAGSNPFGTFSAVNGQNYVNNPMGGASTDIEFDGFTQGTSVNVQGLLIDSTYTITIAIADATDGIYDSAIFLEACDGCNYTLSSAEQESIGEMELFPNPTYDAITLSYPGDHDFQLIDVAGAVLLEGEFSNEHVLSLQEVSSGSYVLRLEDGTAHKIIRR